MEYFIHIGIMLLIYAVLAQSLNLIFGLGGLLNLAHISFYAIGAYTTALLSVEGGYSFFPCLIFSVLLSSLFAVPVAEIALRLRDDYFAIGSLAFSLVISSLLINWKSVTNGVLGIAGIPRPEFWGIEFEENINFLLLIGVISVLSLFCLNYIFKSPYALALRALAEYDRAASALGVHGRVAKVISFTIGSLFVGAAGSIFAYYFNYIDPSSFSLSETILLLSIVILGKPGNFKGCLLATVFLVGVIPEGLRFLDIPSSYLGHLRQMIYSLILFSFLIVYRKKLFTKQREV